MTASETSRIDVTVDVVLLTLKNDELHVVLTRRAKAPFKGVLALPGGYVRAQEDKDSEAAATRVLASKAGLCVPYLEQLYTFADRERDARGWSVSISYFAVVPAEILEKAKGGSDALELLPVAGLKAEALAFDHQRIIDAGVERLRNKSNYSTLPVYLAGTEFTLSELQRVYELSLGDKDKLEVANFRRWLKGLDILEEVPGAMRSGAGRAAQVFRVKQGISLRLLDRSIKSR